jgi:hypothetical protein
MERVMRLVVALIVGVITGFAVSYGAPALDLGLDLGLAVNAATRAQPAQWVDRSGKGDRLDRPVAREIPASSIGKQPTRLGKEPSPPLKMLVGCEPVSSPLTGSTATIPGRCVG